MLKLTLSICGEGKRNDEETWTNWHWDQNHQELRPRCNFLKKTNTNTNKYKYKLARTKTANSFGQDAIFSKTAFKE